MIFTLTPAQFEALEQSLATAPKCDLAQGAAPGTGTLTADGVVISYSYDGAASLTATVVARHGLAALDSKADVEKRVIAMFNQFIQGEAK